MNTPVLAIVRDTDLVTKDEVIAAVEAIQAQIDDHFGPVWDTYGLLGAFEKGDEIPETMWIIRLVDICPDDGALGYHIDAAIPSGVVGVKTSQDDGVPWTAVLSHEILELLADPWCTLAFQVGADFYGAEVCDPCEAVTYDVDEIAVSDFIYPNWFRLGSQGPYTYCKSVKEPLALAEGGYASVYRDGAWTQIRGARLRAGREGVRAWSRVSKRTRRVA